MRSWVMQARPPWAGTWLAAIVPPAATRVSQCPLASAAPSSSAARVRCRQINRHAASRDRRHEDRSAVVRREPLTLLGVGAYTRAVGGIKFHVTKHWLTIERD